MVYRYGWFGDRKAGGNKKGRPGRKGTPPLVGEPISTNTLDPANKGSLITLSNGDLTAATTGAGSWGSVRSVTGYTTGKKYFEVVLGADDAGLGYVLAGYCLSTASMSNYLGVSTTSRGFAAWRTGPLSYYNGGGSSINGATVLVYPTDILGIALDIGAASVSIYVNGILAGVNHTYTTPNGAGTYYAGVSLFNTRSITVRFASSSWSYAAPAGYGQW